MSSPTPERLAEIERTHRLYDCCPANCDFCELLAALREAQQRTVPLPSEHYTGTILSLRAQLAKAEAVVRAAEACEQDIKHLEAVEANVDDGFGSKLRRLRNYLNALAAYRERA